MLTLVEFSDFVENAFATLQKLRAAMRRILTGLLCALVATTVAHAYVDFDDSAPPALVRLRKSPLLCNRSADVQPRQTCVLQRDNWQLLVPARSAAGLCEHDLPVPRADPVHVAARSGEQRTTPELLADGPNICAECRKPRLRGRAIRISSMLGSVSIRGNDRTAWFAA